MARNGRPCMNRRSVSNVNIRWRKRQKMTWIEEVKRYGKGISNDALPIASVVTGVLDNAQEEVAEVTMVQEEPRIL
jgi:hypothetical protein